MDNINAYTSTGIKFFKSLLRNNSLLIKPKPISLQIALTERCNLNCGFCSVAKRKKKFEWNYKELVQATMKFKDLGIKTIEITGGGEPTLFHKLDDYILFCDSLGLQIGLITNGIHAAKVLSKKALKILSWMRISMNSLDYVKKIDIPVINGTLGFSYCWGDKASEKGLERLVGIAKKAKGEYLRVVPDCCCTKEELQYQHQIIEPIVENMAKISGFPVFYQKKEFERPNKCYWGYFKPFLYCDGYIYPCSSTVLNDDAGKQFNKIYRLCHWADADNLYDGEGSLSNLLDTSKCNHCVFTAQNNFIELLTTKIKHSNFI